MIRIFAIQISQGGVLIRLDRQEINAANIRELRLSRSKGIAETTVNKACSSLEAVIKVLAATARIKSSHQYRRCRIQEILVRARNQHRRG